MSGGWLRCLVPSGTAAAPGHRRPGAAVAFGLPALGQGISAITVAKVCEVFFTPADAFTFAYQVNSA